MNDKTIYTKIDDGLDGLIEEIASKEGKKKTEVIKELLQKGVDTEQTLLEAEKLKENALDIDSMKTELSDLGSKIPKLFEDYLELSHTLKGTQDVVIERLQGFKDGFGALDGEIVKIKEILPKIDRKIKVCGKLINSLMEFMEKQFHAKRCDAEIKWLKELEE